MFFKEEHISDMLFGFFFVEGKWNLQKNHYSLRFDIDHKVKIQFTIVFLFFWTKKKASLLEFLKNFISIIAPEEGVFNQNHEDWYIHSHLDSTQ